MPSQELQDDQYNMKSNKHRRKDNSTNTKDFVANPFSALRSESYRDLKGDNVVSENDNATASPNCRKPTLYIRLSRKGRAGKVVTVISNFETDNPRSATDLGRDLRKSLGTGGTCTKDNIELQGDHRKACAEWLRNRGFKLKGEI